MSQWYYTRGGERQGPVERAELDSLARGGVLSPDDLVWSEGMADWKPAREIARLFEVPPAPAAPAASGGAPAPDPANPYASPASMVGQAGPAAALPEGGLEVVDPPAMLNVGGPIQLAFEILKKDFGMIFVAGLVYYAVVMGVSFVFSMIQNVMQLAMGGTPGSGGPFGPGGPVDGMEVLMSNAPLFGFMIISNIIQQVVGVYMALGLTRVGMEVIEGKPVRIGALFGEANKLLGAFFGSILLALMVMALPLLAAIPAVFFGMEGNDALMVVFIIVAVLLLIFPGAYLAARFGFYQIVMVDQEKGMADAFRESSRLTNGNKWVIVALYVVLGLINLAGVLALCVGLLFTLPLTMLAWFVTYKWMAHGPEPLWQIHRPKLPGM